MSDVKSAEMKARLAARAARRAQYLAREKERMRAAYRRRALGAEAEERVDVDPADLAPREVRCTLDPGACWAIFR